MKKLLIFLITIFGVFSLASCSNEIDYTKDVSSLEKKIYKEWLGNVSYKNERISIEGETYSTKDTRFELFLPENIEESSRYASQSIESAYSDLRLKSVSLAYWTLLPIQGMDTFAIHQFSTIYEKQIAPAFTKISTVNYTDKWITPIENSKVEELEKVENQDRGLSVLYIPVKCKFFLAKQDADAVEKAETYILVPVYSELGYLVDGKPVDGTLKDKFAKVELNIAENGGFE